MNDELTQTPRYAAVLASAMGIAREMDHHHLGVEHLFLAIIRDGNALPTQMLATLADIDEIDLNLTRLMESPGYNASRPR